ncbi:MAG: rane-anchored mycosin [Nocardioidaceae bacterium]|nr:rane-anchored mycosin [Nocardioidaceae bacterium]
MRSSLAYAAVLAVSVMICPAASADDGVEGDCQEISAQDATHYATSRPSLPLQEMGVDDALARLKKEHVKPGAGVVVAVIDSGVASAAPITIAGQPVETGNKVAAATDYHGTAVAGLIAGHRRPDGGGPVGIAPYAQIYDVQVYDEADASTAPDSTGSPITVENLRQGLDAVIAAVPTLGIRIVNMSLAIPDDDEIRAKIAQLWALGVVVVAPTGNRSSELPMPSDLPSTFEAHQSGEDAAPYVHPADYDDVLGVNATPAGSSNLEPTNWVLENSSTDVAAPTAGAVSYSLRGESCLLNDPATSYAAAEVSGVLALLQSAYDESVAASVRRLLTTANGRPDIPNTLVGAGEVQAMDALTRPMDINDSGTDLGAGSVQHEPQLLTVPEEPDDVLAKTRQDAVWWGLVGGGALLLAVVLRPVLARRRRTVSR